MVTKKLILRPYDFKTELLRVGELKMNMAIEGSPGAPLVVMLHGFPEFWYSWRHQIKALANAGYRVVAPDQRGYNLTDKRPPYDLITLTDDIQRLIHTLGYDRASIIGHDWGGGVAWVFGARFPEMTQNLLVLNCPHPLIVTNVIRKLYVIQAFRSLYMAFFQLPMIPEAVLSRKNYDVLADAMRGSVPEITNEEIGYYREAWSQPGALTGSLNWYRTLFQNRLHQPIDLTVRIPAHLIWGLPDLFLDARLAEWTKDYVPHLSLHHFPRTSHFVHQVIPTEINRLLIRSLEAVFN